MVAIVTELLENNERFVGMLESLLEEVQRARSTSQSARHAAGTVDRLSSIVVPLTRLLLTPHNQTARVVTAFVSILAGLVDVASYAFADFRSDQFLVSLRNLVEEEEKSQRELSRFWGIDLGSE